MGSACPYAPPRRLTARPIAVWGDSDSEALFRYSSSPVWQCIRLPLTRAAATGLLIVVVDCLSNIVDFAPNHAIMTSTITTPPITNIRRISRSPSLVRALSIERLTKLETTHLLSGRLQNRQCGTIADIDYREQC